MRKTILFLCFVLMINQLPTKAISAASAVVIDATNNRILYEHNAYEKRSMASTTKIMTALCALENGNLEDMVTVSTHAAAVEGSSIWLESGEKITLKSLLIGLLLYSQPLFLVGIVLFSLTTVFQLITLPVEFNASARAIETIEGQGLLYEDEVGGAKKVLRAAAMTYVAALLMSMLQLLRYVLIFVGRNGGGSRGGGRE